jgi:peptidylprolyl isomerase
MQHHTLVLLALASTGCAIHGGPAKLPASIPAVAGKPRDLIALTYIDVVKGTGAPAVPHACLYVHYTGWTTDGKKFDSSRDFLPDGGQRTPIAFQQGARHVIQGWDMGFDGMRVGGKRRLFIPYQFGYGENGAPPDIPPKATLIFDVELMAVGEQTPACPPWDAIKKSN